jgi:hypothetical protein
VIWIALSSLISAFFEFFSDSFPISLLHFSLFFFVPAKSRRGGRRG